MSWAMKFSITLHTHQTSHLPTTTFQTPSQLLGGKCFRNQDDAKMAFNDFIASRTPEFYQHGMNHGSSEPKFHLNDSHEQMLVHWVGKDGNVVVCLTRDRILMANSKTTVYISRDNGRTFTVVDKMTISPEKPAIINKAFTSPIVKDLIIFTDVIHNCIFTTSDTGQTFQRNFVPFKPDVISFHPLNQNVILATDTDDFFRKLWLSDDFGITWTEIQMGVKSFY
ncbi:SORL1, partial [Cordylochernes scorpioides]